MLIYWAEAYILQRKAQIFSSCY